jgi:hypothetical protein
LGFILFVALLLAFILFRTFRQARRRMIGGAVRSIDSALATGMESAGRSATPSL